MCYVTWHLYVIVLASRIAIYLRIRNVKHSHCVYALVAWLLFVALRLYLLAFNEEKTQAINYPIIKLN